MKFIPPEYTNDATLISSNVPENDYPAYDAGATYGVGNVEGDDGNTVIYIANDIHWVVRSLTASNTGNTPTGLSNDPNWKKVSETNRWKMFDLKTTSQTTNGGSIHVKIAGVAFNDRLTLLNMSGTYLDVVAKDQELSTFYTYSGSLISTENIYDYYSYFYAPRVELTDIVLEMPVHAVSTYEVTITNPTTAKCGSLLLGKFQDSGQTKYGMKLGNADYSIKQADEFGDFIITERTYSRTMDLTAYVPKAQVDGLVNLLNQYRATPVVWLGAEEYSSSFIYGFYKDYEVIVSYPTYSLLDIEIEGLS